MNISIMPLFFITSYEKKSVNMIKINIKETITSQMAIFIPMFVLWKLLRLFSYTFFALSRLKDAKMYKD